ncbi:MAG: hypothetical protein OXG79_13680 [Chloroflexi bacterium]|nr:hypothetical protein [Chloroflexota bacterium]
MSYQRRQRVRDTAMSMANTIGAKYSDLRVTIDMESVDGEDAFVWIEVLRGLRPAELPTFIDRLARQCARRTGFWIVPRIVSTSVESQPELRLRPRVGSARPSVT